MKKLLLIVFGLLTLTVGKADEFIERDFSLYGLYPEFLYDNEQLIYTKHWDENYYGDDFINGTYTILNENLSEVFSKSFTESWYDYQDGDQYRADVTLPDGTKLPVGDWEEPKLSDSTKRVFDFLSIRIDDIVYDVNAEATFSQTLFNNDKNFEYLVPIIELRDIIRESTIGEFYYWYKDRDWYDEYKNVVYYRRIYKNYPVMVGCNVMSENGNILSTIRFPEGYWDDAPNSDDAVKGDAVKLVVFNNVVYIEFYVEDSNGHSITLLYKVDRHGTGFSAPKIIDHGVRVRPTDVARSQTVRVSLNEPLDHQCKVVVVGVNGQVVSSSTIAAGAEGTEINTSNFAPGIYVVNVQDGETVKENCKIIVR